MASLFNLKPTHKPVAAYYAARAQFHKHGHDTEGNTRSAFADLLKRCATPYGWHLVEEYQLKGTNKKPLRADGALVDSLTLVHGLWKAKDTSDDLKLEIKSKAAKGYPLTNILFQSPDRAVLYQDDRIARDCDLRDPEELIEILQLFFDHRPQQEVDWEEAVVKFSENIPDLANDVTKILEKEHLKNEDFRQKFADFAKLCRQSIDPDLTDDAIRKMLVQHLFIERIIRNVFDDKEFLNRNVLAVEIEKVIKSITDKHFSRDTFLKSLDRFYTAIEEASCSQSGYSEKQHFLSAVYEKFFQSFDVKQTDTRGIVYTPQPIVDFLVSSVEGILQQEFGKSLSDPGVHILDPYTGTGNFITRIMHEIIGTVSKGIADSIRPMVEARQFPEAFVDDLQEVTTFQLPEFVEIELHPIMHEAFLLLRDAQGRTIVEKEFPRAVAQVIVKSLMLGRRGFTAPLNEAKALAALSELDVWLTGIVERIDEGCRLASVGMKYEEDVRAAVLASLQINPRIFDHEFSGAATLVS